jgi:hypothetical protein
VRAEGGRASESRSGNGPRHISCPSRLTPSLTDLPHPNISPHPSLLLRLSSSADHLFQPAQRQHAQRKLALSLAGSNFKLAITDVKALASVASKVQTCVAPINASPHARCNSLQHAATRCNSQRNSAMSAPINEHQWPTLFPATHGPDQCTRNVPSASVDVWAAEGALCPIPAPRLDSFGTPSVVYFNSHGRPIIQQMSTHACGPHVHVLPVAPCPCFPPPPPANWMPSQLDAPKSQRDE